MTTSYNVLSTT